MSKGADKLLTIVKELYPNHKVVLEHNIADHGALFLDIYLPDLSLAFEFDGEQHSNYSSFFHGSRENFIAAKKRDLHKSEACEQKDILLIRIKYNDPLTKDFVFDKIEEALNDQ